MRMSARGWGSGEEEGSRWHTQFQQHHFRNKSIRKVKLTTKLESSLMNKDFSKSQSPLQLLYNLCSPSELKDSTRQHQMNGVLGEGIFVLSTPTLIFCIKSYAGCWRRSRATGKRESLEISAEGAGFLSKSKSKTQGLPTQHKWGVVAGKRKKWHSRAVTIVIENIGLITIHNDGNLVMNSSNDVSLNETHGNDLYNNSIKN